ncbi:hypothetical protein HMPREF0083_04502 [Aneurinibacillus aneurinilyticus ATCC 12856]|uniref:Uncharacterized protein n=1 Tax=Aneurinibacillus aneurinilyticus ATCC 12856 TaxID=649747 RepID=U1Y5H6_ANEAE|nr:hypothetical protein HMPREF0083_04502 [Aneurinibacillus aneurinilyticus ATCC 12856]
MERGRKKGGCTLRSGRRKAHVSFSDRLPQTCVDLSNQIYITTPVDYP